MKTVIHNGLYRKIHWNLIRDITDKFSSNDLNDEHIKYLGSFLKDSLYF